MGLDTATDKAVSELKVFTFNSKVNQGKSQSFRVINDAYLIAKDLSDYVGWDPTPLKGALEKVAGIKRQDLVPVENIRRAMTICTFSEFDTVVTKKRDDPRVSIAKKLLLTELSTTFFDELYTFLGIERNKEITIDAGREFRVCTPTQPQTFSDKARTLLAEVGVPAHYINKSIDLGHISLRVQQQPYKQEMFGIVGECKTPDTSVTVYLTEDNQPTEEAQMSVEDLANPKERIWSPRWVDLHALGINLLKKCRVRPNPSPGAFTVMPNNIGEKLNPNAICYRRITREDTERQEQIWYEDNSVLIVYVWRGVYSTRFEWDYDLDYAATGKLIRVLHMGEKRAHNPKEFARLYPTYMNDFLKGRKLHELLYTTPNR